MKIKVISLDNKAKGELDLNDAVFGLPERADILQRMVEYQRAKKRAGTHKVKGLGEVSGRKAKPFKQKGTGRARAGTTRAPQHRGGGIVFGPVVRSHAIDLPKKVRKLALKTALSVKAKSGKLIVVDSLEMKDAKTKAAKENFTKLGVSSALFVDAATINDNFRRATANIPGIDALPQIGANVYDILRHDTLVLTKEAVEKLEARLS